MATRLWLMVLMLAFFSSCRGPKGSPGGTVKSFFSSILAKDWEAMADIASQKSLQKAGTRERAVAYFEASYSMWTDASVTVDEELIDGDGNGATVLFRCIGTEYVKHKESNFDCSDTYALVKEEDEKWHLHLPGAGGIKRM